MHRRRMTEDKDPEMYRAMLAPVPMYWSQLTARVPDDVLRRPATEGEWSAFQCLCHMLDTEAYVFPLRLRVFLDGGDAFRNFDPDREGTDYTGMSPAEVAQRFSGLRAESLELMAKVERHHMGRRAKHSELGLVSLEQFLNEWIAHDFNHTIQAERALMQQFIEGCGPWRHYFKDHDLGELDKSRKSEVTTDN